MLGGHARDQHAEHLAAQQRLVAADQRAVHRIAAARPPTGRPAAAPRAARSSSARRTRCSASRDGVQSRRVAAVGHHGRGVGVLAGQLGQAQLDDLRDVVGGAVVGAHREHHGRAEVDGDPRIRRQLARRRDVGVVAADDHARRRTGLRHLVVAVDDVGDRGVGVLVQLLVVRRRRTRSYVRPAVAVGEQQLEDVVAVLAQPGDRPEHPHLGDGRREPVQDAERDGRLAGVTLRRRYVDRGVGAGAVTSLSHHRFADGHGLPTGRSMMVARPR